MTKSEQEVVLSKCADEREWCVYSTHPLWTRRLRVLARKTGGREVFHQGGYKFFLPADQLRITAKRQVTLTEAHRDQLRANAQAARSRALSPA